MEDTIFSESGTSVSGDDESTIPQPFESWKGFEKFAEQYLLGDPDDDAFSYEETVDETVEEVKSLEGSILRINSTVDTRLSSVSNGSDDDEGENKAIAIPTTPKRTYGFIPPVKACTTPTSGWARPASFSENPLSPISPTGDSVALRYPPQKKPALRKRVPKVLPKPTTNLRASQDTGCNMLTNWSLEENEIVFAKTDDDDSFNDDEYSLWKDELLWSRTEGAFGQNTNDQNNETKHPPHSAGVHSNKMKGQKKKASNAPTPRRTAIARTPTAHVDSLKVPDLLPKAFSVKEATKKKNHRQEKNNESSKLPRLKIPSLDAVELSRRSPTQFRAFAPPKTPVSPKFELLIPSLDQSEGIEVKSKSPRKMKLRAPFVGGSALVNRALKTMKPTAKLSTGNDKPAKLSSGLSLNMTDSDLDQSIEVTTENWRQSVLSWPKSPLSRSSKKQSAIVIVPEDKVSEDKTRSDLETTPSKLATPKAANGQDKRNTSSSKLIVSASVVDESVEMTRESQQKQGLFSFLTSPSNHAQLIEPTSSEPQNDSDDREGVAYQVSGLETKYETTRSFPRVPSHLPINAAPRSRKADTLDVKRRKLSKLFQFSKGKANMVKPSRAFHDVLENSLVEEQPIQRAEPSLVKCLHPLFSIFDHIPKTETNRVKPILHASGQPPIEKTRKLTKSDAGNPPAAGTKQSPPNDPCASKEHASNGNRKNLHAAGACLVVDPSIMQDPLGPSFDDTENGHGCTDGRCLANAVKARIIGSADQPKDHTVILYPILDFNPCRTEIIFNKDNNVLSLQNEASLQEMQHLATVTAEDIEKEVVKPKAKSKHGDAGNVAATAADSNLAKKNQQTEGTFRRIRRRRLRNPFALLTPSRKGKVFAASTTKSDASTLQQDRSESTTMEKADENVTVTDESETKNRVSFEQDTTGTCLESQLFGDATSEPANIPGDLPRTKSAIRKGRFGILKAPSLKTTDQPVMTEHSQRSHTPSPIENSHWDSPRAESSISRFSSAVRLLSLKSRAAKSTDKGAAQHSVAATRESDMGYSQSTQKTTNHTPLSEVVESLPSFPSSRRSKHSKSTKSSSKTHSPVDAGDKISRSTKGPSKASNQVDAGDKITRRLATDLKILSLIQEKKRMSSPTDSETLSDASTGERRARRSRKSLETLLILRAVDGLVKQRMREAAAKKEEPPKPSLGSTMSDFFGGLMYSQNENLTDDDETLRESEHSLIK